MLSFSMRHFPVTKNPCRKVRLTLAELEAPPGSSLAVFFPFHHSGIPCQKAVVPQGNGIALVDLAKRPRKAMPAGAGLAVGAAAVNVYQYIKFIFTGGYHQGLPYHHRVFALGEIKGKIPAVYGDFAFSGPDIDPGDRCFAPSCTDS
jgi:hypothetical protein